MKFFILFSLSLITVLLNAQTDCEINTINPDFEDPVIVQSGWPTFLDASLVPGWQTTAGDNQIEIWPNSNNGGGVMAYSGNQYIELNANVTSGVYQDYSTPIDGIVFTYSFAHSARNSASFGFDVVGVYAGPPGGPLVELAQYSSEVFTGWHLYTGNYTVPLGQPVTRFEFRAVSTASGNTTVGNFLDAIEFTSNFGIASDPELFLACEENDATGIQTVGIGNWSYATGLPVPIEVSPDNWEISGFVTSGDYTYTWDNGFCEADLIIHYSNESITILDDHLEKQICETDPIINLELYESEISTDADDFIFYEDQQDAQDGNGNFIPDPTNYNLSENTTVYVRVEKAGHCTEIVEIQLELISSPDVAPEIIIPPKCDDDFDGFVEFNLDQEAFPLIYPDPNYNITYHLSQFEAENGIDPQSSTVSLIPGNSAIYWARVSLGGCWVVSEIHLEANQGIDGVALQDELSPELVCDEDFDGIIQVDLTIWESELFDGTGSVNYFYYLTETDAIAGTDPITTDVENYQLNGQFIFWVALLNSDGCKEVRFIEFQLNNELAGVTAQEDIQTKALCDEDFDGQVFVNLTLWESELIANPNTVSFAYYLSQPNAISGTNPITGDVENYPLNQFNFWIVIIGDSGCKELREVQYEMSDAISTTDNEFQLPDVCLLIEDTIDLTQLNLTITTEPDVNFLYYPTEAQAQIGGTGAINNPNSYPVSGNGSVFVRLESTDGSRCPAIVELKFELGVDVPHEPSPYSLSGICEDIPLDLPLINSQIITDNTIDVNYFETENEAINNLNPIINYTEYNPNSNSGTLYVRLELTDHCPVVLPFTFERALLPENPFIELPKLCSGNELTLDAGDLYPNENYEWNWEGGQFIGSELVINEPGLYQLTVTTEEGCSKTFEIDIEQPEAPVITGFEIGDTYIVVSVAGNGTGLEFSLDGVFWQSNPRFDNLSPGVEYTLHVRERGCEPVSAKATILSIPNFISPNNDGKNDNWTIRGLNNSMECSVKIFDRYGKIFVDSGIQIMDGFSWNGKYKGESVPSSDYWYIISIKNENLVETKYIGHISVRN